MVTELRRAAKRTLIRTAPAEVVDRLRNAKRRWKRMRFRARESVRPVLVEKAEIVDALRRAGVRSGDAVFFQSSLSAFGRIDGGAETVLDALDEVVGDGLVAMPAFSLAGSTDEYPSLIEFDAAQTPSLMGAVTERFRNRPEVLRSLHPTHSVSARGNGADSLIEGHAEAETPFGAGTPFARLVERDAVQVWFGCGVGPFTLYHTFECLREQGFPLPVFAANRIAAECTDLDGSTREVTTLVHEPRLAEQRIDALPHVQERIRTLLLESGALQSATLGRGEILTIRTKTMMAELERLFAQGVTIYDVELPRHESASAA